jgi:nucleoid-associated protein YgaU
MGSVRQAVLEFDEEIQAPWRPRLVAVAAAGEAEGRRPARPHPSGRSSSRVGVCRPPESPVHSRVPARGAAGSGRRAGAPPVRGASVARRRAAGDVRARPPVGSGFRLTRRARRLAAVLTLSLGVAIGSWVGPLLAGADGDLRLAGVQSVVVQPGDTLWSIATEAAGTDDVREVVDRIQELNGLEDAVLIPGQVLELP